MSTSPFDTARPAFPLSCPVAMPLRALIVVFCLDRCGQRRSACRRTAPHRRREAAHSLRRYCRCHVAGRRLPLHCRIERGEVRRPDSSVGRQPLIDTCRHEMVIIRASVHELGVERRHVRVELSGGIQRRVGSSDRVPPHDRVGEVRRKRTVAVARAAAEDAVLDYEARCCS